MTDRARWSEPRTWGLEPPARDLITMDMLNRELTENMRHLRQSSLFPLAEERLISPGTFNINVTGLGEPVGYRHLYLWLRLKGTTASEFVDVQMTFNNDTGSNYFPQRLLNSGTALSATRASGKQIAVMPGTHNNNTNRFGFLELWVWNYRGLDSNRILTWIEAFTGTTGQSYAMFAWSWTGTQVDSIQVFPASNSFVPGSEYVLRGLRA
jgi:hypothetical protein